MKAYLDIHTHRRNKSPDSVTVASLSLAEILNEETPGDYNTAGIHPWWIEDHSREELLAIQEHLLHLLKENKLWGIGETGLDRGYPEFFDQQKELFYWHLELSEKYQLPLIIHSVRSGADFLQILKDKKPHSPWLFHDFRGNENLVRDLLRLHPECYFSFGMSIDNSPQIRELLPLIPLDKLFLETDEQKHLDIHDIHLRATHHLDMDIEFLKAQIWHNFRKIGPQKNIS